MFLFPYLFFRLNTAVTAYMQNSYAPSGHTRSYKQTAVTERRILFRTEDTGAVFLYLFDQTVNPPGKIVLVPYVIIGY
jgi:hypothetical protein